jgi:hypothetical protein
MRGQYYTLNAIASRIWELLEPASATSELITTLAAEYEVTNDILERDVGILLQELYRRDLVICEGS